MDSELRTALASLRFLVQEGNKAAELLGKENQRLRDENDLLRADPASAEVLALIERIDELEKRFKDRMAARLATGMALGVRMAKTGAKKSGTSPRSRPTSSEE